MGNKAVIYVRVDQETNRQLEALQKYHGIKNRTQFINFLLNKEYRQIFGTNGHKPDSKRGEVK